MLLVKTQLLREQRREPRALSAFEDLDRRFRDDTDPVIRWVFALALLAKGEALRQDGRQDQADAAMDTLVARNGEDTDALLGAITARARSLRTFVPGIEEAVARRRRQRARPIGGSQISLDHPDRPGSRQLVELGRGLVRSRGDDYSLRDQSARNPTEKFNISHSNGPVLRVAAPRVWGEESVSLR